MRQLEFCHGLLAELPAGEPTRAGAAPENYRQPGLSFNAVSASTLATLIDVGPSTLSGPLLPARICAADGQSVRKRQQARRSPRLIV